MKIHHWWTLSVTRSVKARSKPPRQHPHPHVHSSYLFRALKAISQAEFPAHGKSTNVHKLEFSYKTCVGSSFGSEGYFRTRAKSFVRTSSCWSHSPQLTTLIVLFQSWVYPPALCCTNYLWQKIMESDIPLFFGFARFQESNGDEPTRTTVEVLQATGSYANSRKLDNGTANALNLRNNILDKTHWRSQIQGLIHFGRNSKKGTIKRQRGKRKQPFMQSIKPSSGCLHHLMEKSPLFYGTCVDFLMLLPLMYYLTPGISFNDFNEILSNCS